MVRLTRILAKYQSRRFRLCKTKSHRRRQRCHEGPARQLTSGARRAIAYLVVDALVKVLDEDVSLTGLSESWVSLGPHDSAWLVLDQRVVEVLEGSLTISRAEVVDVGVAKRSSGDGVSADSDAGYISWGKKPS